MLNIVDIKFAYRRQTCVGIYHDPSSLHMQSSLAENGHENLYRDLLLARHLVEFLLCGHFWVSFRQLV